ncbi:Putative Hydrolase-HD superfamily protein [Lichtheimia ramosa]|uniref:Putative Hydrolase-HD superfamily protein n=1 Tax=Lichtheimia ramosa TaxID=688394 RepID=A0A077WSF9_9FUNG|nr:Putative Hydrolase-HD superfamily protein [Lichtheimia ramosa]
MQDFQSMLGNTPVAQEIVDLWQEYEDAKTPEALLVKDLDKFEMIVQALEYEKSDKKSLQSFFDSTQGKFQHPTIKAWTEALYAERRLL